MADPDELESQADDTAAEREDAYADSEEKERLLRQAADEARDSEADEAAANATGGGDE